MPRWLKTLYAWIARRRHRKNARRTSIKRATSYPEYRSARSSRSNTPRHTSRSTSPTPASMRARTNERVSIINPSTTPPRPLSHNKQHTGPQWTDQRVMTNPALVQEPLRRQHTAPTPGHYSMGYVTIPPQQPAVYILPPNSQPQFRQSNYIANPFIAPFEQPGNLKQVPTGHFPAHYVPHADPRIPQTQALVHHPRYSSDSSTSLRRPSPLTRHVRTRTRTVKQTTASSPDQVRAAWKRYQDFWERHKYGVAPGTVLTFYDIPWPVVNPPKLPTSMTVSAVKAFLLSPHHSHGISPREIVEEARVAWYPRSFMGHFGPYIAHGHAELIERAVNFLRGTLILLYEEVSNVEAAQAVPKSS